MDQERNLTQLVRVLAGMVRAEEQLATGIEFHLNVSLCAAAIASIDCGKPQKLCS